jgi:hypothetical protein
MLYANFSYIHKPTIAVLKQILSLYINVADPAIYILSGLLPIEAEIHIKVLTFFRNITRSEHTSIIGVHVWLSNFSIVTLEVDFLDMYMDP